MTTLTEAAEAPLNLRITMEELAKAHATIIDLRADLATAANVIANLTARLDGVRAATGQSEFDSAAEGAFVDEAIAEKQRCLNASLDREQTLTEERDALAAFKAYVHKRLDDASVPADPEPASNAQHGCRIEGRLNHVLGALLASEARVAELEADVALRVADASRAVACVNALAGVEDPAAFVASYREMLAALLDRCPEATEPGDFGCLVETPLDLCASCAVIDRARKAGPSP